MKHVAQALTGLIGAVLIAAPAAAQTKWNLPTAYPAENYQTENTSFFAKQVQDTTGGTLAITVHPNASLFKAPEIKRAVQTGQAQAGEVIMSLHENEDPLYGLDVIPFLATSFQQAHKLWTVQKPAIEKKLAAQGMMLLYAVAWPPQGIFSKTEINKLEDLKGLKFRTYNVGTARIAELTGAQPVTIQAAELSQALATGVVTAFMSAGPTGMDIKAWETVKYFYDVQGWIPKQMVFVNRAAFNALPKPTQDAVLKAAQAAEERGWKVAEEKTKSSLEALAGRGMAIRPPSPALAADLKKIGDRLTNDWLQKAGNDGKAVLEAYRKM